MERAWATQTSAGLREAVGRALAGTDPLPTLHTLLALPERLAGHRGHARVLVVLEEFQSLGRVPGAEALLRSHAQHQRADASYLFAGSEPAMLTAAFNERSRPFYGQVETLLLSRLPGAELAAAIGAAFERTERHAGEVLAQLVGASEGHPQRAMLLAHLLWIRVAEGQVASRQDWDEALSAALTRIDADARAVLRGLQPGERKTLRAVAEYGGPLVARAAEHWTWPR